MTIATSGLDYAVRALVHLAAEPGPVPRGEIARANGIPAQFLGDVLQQLRRAGLVRARRGDHGGYWLARSPDSITVADIIRAVGGGAGAGALVHRTPIAALWTAIDGAVHDAAARITLVEVTRLVAPARAPRARHEQRSS